MRSLETVSAITVARWEYRRTWNYLRKSFYKPAFLAVQIVSLAIILLVNWLFWLLIYELPVSLRGFLYWLIIDTGLVGINSIWIVYAVLTFGIVQQIIKAIMGVPLGSKSEPADVDYLLLAPMQGHSFYIAKYLHSIPRRLIFVLIVIIAIQPLLWYFGLNFGLTIGMLLLLILFVFLLGEIGSVATQGLYSLRKFVSQPRPQQRSFRVIFYLTLVLGIILLLSPIWWINGTYVSSPIYNLAYMLVSMVFSGAQIGSEGSFTYLYYPALPGVISGLILGFVVIFLLTCKITDKVTVDLYEEIATVIHQKGTYLGVLSWLPIKYSLAKTPTRALFKKDIITGARKPGKTLFLAGLAINFIFALFFPFLISSIGFSFQLPSEFLPFDKILYAILLIVIIPLLAISSSDPFQSEYRTLYLIRLAPMTSLRFALIKYSQLLLTPICLAVPFAIYFAVMLGGLYLLPIALMILPHAILIATAIGLALGSFYPYASRMKNETPIGLIITFPFLSWLAIIPVLIFQLGCLSAGTVFMILSCLLVVPYTFFLVLILLRWSANSYLNQE